MRAFYRATQDIVDGHTLDQCGVITRQLPLDAAAYQATLDDLRTQRGYTTQDEVCLSSETPNLDAILQKFDGAPLHADDEVRFVPEGEGIFDIRDHADRWMRIVVEPGDLIVVPRGTHHRFELSQRQRIRCLRLFKDPSGWVPVYRAPAL